MTGSLVSGVIFFRLEHVSNATTSIFNKSMADWIISFLMCSLATTLYSTGEFNFSILIRTDDINDSQELSHTSYGNLRGVCVSITSQWVVALAAASSEPSWTQQPFTRSTTSSTWCFTNRRAMSKACRPI